MIGEIEIMDLQLLFKKIKFIFPLHTFNDNKILKVIPFELIYWNYLGFSISL